MSEPSKTDPVQEPSGQLFAERSRVASALSESLLPPLLPTMPGLHAAARYRPSSADMTGRSNLVGGDFYDLFEMGDGRFALLLGDVSGVGPEAAALTGVARYTVRAVADRRTARKGRKGFAQ